MDRHVDQVNKSHPLLGFLHIVNVLLVLITNVYKFTYLQIFIKNKQGMYGNTCQLLLVMMGLMGEPHVDKKNRKKITKSQCVLLVQIDKHFFVFLFIYRENFSRCMLYRHNAAIGTDWTWFFGIIHCVFVFSNMQILYKPYHEKNKKH